MLLLKALKETLRLTSVFSKIAFKMYLFKSQQINCKNINFYNGKHFKENILNIGYNALLYIKGKAIS
jgi:hypothetical protein